jgi:hypothetical protein
MFIGGSFTLNQKISFAFLDHANYFLQVFFAKAARFDEVDEERFGRAIENTINEFADHAADDLILGLRGAVKEGAILAALFEIALGLEDLHHGHDGGVSDLAALEEGLVDIAHGGGAALPHELHDLEFLGSKRAVPWAHIAFLVLINSYVKQKDAEPALRRKTKRQKAKGRMRKEETRRQACGTEMTSLSGLCDSLSSTNEQESGEEERV